MSYRHNRSACRPWLIGLLAAMISPALIGLIFAIRQRSWMLLAAPLAIIVVCNFFLYPPSPGPILKFAGQVLAGLAAYLIARKQKLDILYGAAGESSLNAVTASQITPPLFSEKKRSNPLISAVAIIPAFLLSQLVVKPNMYYLFQVSSETSNGTIRLISAASVLVSGLIIAGTLFFIASYYPAQHLQDKTTLASGQKEEAMPNAPNFSSTENRKSDLKETTGYGDHAVEESLSRLAALHEKGLITEQEYDQLRRKTLGL